MNIEVTQKVRGESNEQVQRYMSMISEMLDSGQVDQGAYKHLEKQVTFHATQVDNYDLELNKLWKTEVDQQLNFAKTLISEMKPLGEHFAAAVTAIRSDLGLAPETQAFKEQMMKQWTLMESEMAKTLQALQDKAEESTK